MKLNELRKVTGFAEKECINRFTVQSALVNMKFMQTEFFQHGSCIIRKTVIHWRPN